MLVAMTNNPMLPETWQAIGLPLVTLDVVTGEGWGPQSCRIVEVTRWIRP
jgi:hypothetical protein